MRILTESQPVSKPSYIHLAYVSAAPAATFLLSAGIILGIVILIRAALSALHNRKAKLSKPKTADLDTKNDKD